MNTKEVQALESYFKTENDCDMMKNLFNPKSSIMELPPNALFKVSTVRRSKPVCLKEYDTVDVYSGSCGYGEYYDNMQRPYAKNQTRCYGGAE